MFACISYKLKFLKVINVSEGGEEYSEKMCGLHIDLSFIHCLQEFPHRHPSWECVNDIYHDYRFPPNLQSSVSEAARRGEEAPLCCAGLGS